jgi:HAD superfamily hydrolase (TIGR01509 family)
MDERGLGKQLQAARQAGGLTQQQLCQQANLSFSTLTKIERGAIKAPSIFTVQAIAGALGVGLDELLGNPASVKNYKKTKSGVTFVFFDVNGCLVHFYQRAFADLARDTGTSADVVETVFWQYNDDACRGAISLEDFNAKLAEKLNVDSVDWQKYYLEAIEPLEEMQELLIWAADHYKVGLMTNIMPGLLNALRQSGKLPNIRYDAIVDSSEVGTIKPEGKMYEMAQAQAGVPTEEILLIDDARSNLMAAAELGWHVLGFDDARPTESVAMSREALEPAD